MLCMKIVSDHHLKFDAGLPDTVTELSFAVTSSPNFCISELGCLILGGGLCSLLGLLQRQGYPRRPPAVVDVATVSRAPHSPCCRHRRTLPLLQHLIIQEQRPLPQFVVVFPLLTILINQIERTKASQSFPPSTKPPR